MASASSVSLLGRRLRIPHCRQRVFSSPRAAGSTLQDFQWVRRQGSAGTSRWPRAWFSSPPPPPDDPSALSAMSDDDKEDELAAKEWSDPSSSLLSSLDDVESPWVGEASSLWQDDDDEDDLADDRRERKEYLEKQQAVQEELNLRKGREWSDPWEITEADWSRVSTTSDDLLDWTPDCVSRIAQERLRIHPDGIPTLDQLAAMLPDPSQVKREHMHPSVDMMQYVKYRNQQHYASVQQKVQELAAPKIESIQKAKDMQQAVDDLYALVEAQLRKQETILEKHPKFTSWVERALEGYLIQINKKELLKSQAEDDEDAKLDSETSDEAALELPIFMDCAAAVSTDVQENEKSDEDKEKPLVPFILSPLTPHKHAGPGRMVEEWELAAHEGTKRILIRSATCQIAYHMLEEGESGKVILLHGGKGRGKSAVLASIVAAARKTPETIVLYLPDGDRFRKNGFYVTPNRHRPDMFDLPNLTLEACQQLHTVHGQQLQTIPAPANVLEKYFAAPDLEALSKTEEAVSLSDLVELGASKKELASGCYSAVLETLCQHQDSFRFVMVADEYNCYFDRGHYYHMKFDDSVRNPIPLKQISLFEPFLRTNDAFVPRKGGLVVATTESHAVPHAVTQQLTEAFSNDICIEIPRFSNVEANHILANFEAIGVGKLRLDRGDTLLNEQEVAYLKMISGNVGQQLLDASIM